VIERYLLLARVRSFALRSDRLIQIALQDFSQLREPA
jgi:hypothetical protein